MRRHRFPIRRPRPLRAVSTAALALAAACAAPGSASDWRATLQHKLPLLGHRNFVVVADAAYPLQSNASIRTILADGEHLDVVDAVLDAIAKGPHVRPVVWLDAELEFVPEASAPGVDGYRSALNERLAGLDVKRAPHEAIIAKLDETAQLFEVLLIKTDLTIPYTSVFVELQCGYWGDEAETAMRRAIEQAGR